MSTSETQPAESYAARAADVRAIVTEGRAHDAEVLAVLASVADCLEEARSIVEENASDLADLRTKNEQLRRTVEDSAVCCRQLREMAEMALALAASKGSRAAGRILTSFKASYATAQETTQ